MMRMPGLIVALAMAGGWAGPVEDDPRIEWLREHAVRLRSIDPSDEDFSDLQALRAALDDARVVQLGEQSHGDGATFHAKIRLIKLLHQEMGFDVLAFESGLYDCRKAWERFRAGADPIEAAQEGIFPIWTESREVEPLFEYVAAAARTERPLEISGFDCQFTGKASRESLHEDLEAFVWKIDPRPVDEETWEAVDELIEHLQEGGTKPLVPAARERALAALDALRRGLEGPAAARAHPEEELSFWRRFLGSTAAYARIVWARTDEAAKLSERFNPRDAEMGRNLVWLAKERYPGRKIIVWGATMHVQRNAQVIDTRTPVLDYEGVETMGHHAWRALGEELYTIGFIAHSGRAGLPWSEPWDIGVAEAGSLEDLCARAGLENAFVDFRGLPEGSWLRRPIVSRPLGHRPMQADWSRVLDGVVFTRTMFPSRRRYPKEEVERVRDLMAAVEREWERAEERLRTGNPWADKVDLNSPYETWRSVFEPSAADIEAMERKVEEWLEGRSRVEGLPWRVNYLLSRMARDRGEAELAAERLDRALAHYPRTAYADPAQHSKFQHMVNDRAMMIWDQERLDAAIAWVARLLATEERYHYFFVVPWDERLRAEGKLDRRAPLLDRIAKAYEERARKFPKHAAKAGEYARGLRGR